MARAAISTEGLVGHLCHVRPAHHNRDARGADGVGDPVRLCNHSGHCPDPNQSEALFPHESRDASFIHRLRVAID